MWNILLYRRQVFPRFMFMFRNKICENMKQHGVGISKLPLATFAEWNNNARLLFVNCFGDKSRYMRLTTQLYSNVDVVGSKRE